MKKAAPAIEAEELKTNIPGLLGFIFTLVGLAELVTLGTGIGALLIIAGFVLCLIGLSDFKNERGVYTSNKGSSHWWNRPAINRSHASSTLLALQKN